MNIIELAKEVGLHRLIVHTHVVEKHYESLDPRLEKFAALVAAHEREALAEQEKQEPVAWAYEYGTDKSDDVNEIRWYPNLTALHKPKPEEGSLIRNVRPLYAAPVDAKAIRAEALEEAEEIAKTIGGSFSEEFLAAIRGLK